MGALKNLVGEKFGRLEVIERASNVGAGKVKWLCRCECGNSAIAQTAHLLDGRRVSCGCAKIAGNQLNKKKVRHGQCINNRSTKIYRAWSSMLNRCENKNNHGYKHYGGRGVKVCKRWRIFENFIADMGIPSEGMSLDRIDVNGNYEPGNCRWATAKEQARNKRSNMIVTLHGISMTLIEWSEKYNIDKSTLWSRLIKCGWDMEKAISEKLWTKSDAAVYGNKVRWGGK